MIIVSDSEARPSNRFWDVGASADLSVRFLGYVGAIGAT